MAERLHGKIKSVFLTEVYISDLFNEGNYLETGSYKLNSNGSWIDFFALSNQQLGSTNGERTLQIDKWTDLITFKAPGLVKGENHEFSVAGVDYAMSPTHAPLPPTVYLFGSGLLSLVLIRRRFKE